MRKQGPDGRGSRTSTRGLELQYSVDLFLTEESWTAATTEPPSAEKLHSFYLAVLKALLVLATGADLMISFRRKSIGAIQQTYQPTYNSKICANRAE